MERSKINTAIRHIAAHMIRGGEMAFWATVQENEAPCRLRRSEHPVAK